MQGGGIQSRSPYLDLRSEGWRCEPRGGSRIGHHPEARCWVCHPHGHSHSESRERQLWKDRSFTKLFSDNRGASKKRPTGDQDGVGMGSPVAWAWEELRLWRKQENSGLWVVVKSKEDAHLRGSSRGAGGRVKGLPNSAVGTQCPGGQPASGGARTCCGHSGKRLRN